MVVLADHSFNKFFIPLFKETFSCYSKAVRLSWDVSCFNLEC